MVGTWQRLAHAVLGSDGDTFDTGTFTAKDNLRIIVWTKGTTGGTYQGLRFNDDTGSNYAHRRSEAGGSDGTNTSQSFMQVSDSDIANSGGYTVTDITNISGKEKLAITHSVMGSSSGAGTAPDRDEFVSKWANTSAQITKIQVYNQGSGNFVAGSYITVLGASDDIVTDEKTTLTNVPTGTQYRETDTRKIYRAKIQANYESDFTSDNWTDRNESGNGLTGVDTTDQRFEFKAHASGAVNDSSVYDLGAGNVSDTQWILRWEYTWTSKNDGNGNNHAFGLSSKDEQYHAGDTGADYIFMCWGEPLVSGQSNMGVLAGNGTATSSTGHMPNTTSRVQDTSLTSGTTYYMELKRESATKATFTVWSDSYGGTALSGFPVSNDDEEVESGLSGLRYVKFMNRGGDGTRSGDIIGHINNIEFYNDTTTATKSTVVWKERGTA